MLCRVNPTLLLHCAPSVLSPALEQYCTFLHTSIGVSICRCWNCPRSFQYSDKQLTAKRAGSQQQAPTAAVNQEVEAVRLCWAQQLSDCAGLKITTTPHAAADSLQDHRSLSWLTAYMMVSWHAHLLARRGMCVRHPGPGLAAKCVCRAGVSISLTVHAALG